MKHGTFSLSPRPLGTAPALALVLALSLAGCAGMPTNRSMYSVHEPVVEKVNYTLDVATGDGGLSAPEQKRLADWFDAIKVHYGDHIAVEDPLQSSVTRSDVAAIAGHYGLILSDEAPATAGEVRAGNARVVVTRSQAVVHGCPDWSAHADANFVNGLSPNYGCAVNSNLAAMVANPDHLVKGADNDGDTTVMTSNKAISTFRSKDPTGAGGIKESGTKGD